MVQFFGDSFLKGVCRQKSQFRIWYDLTSDSVFIFPPNRNLAFLLFSPFSSLFSQNHCEPISLSYTKGLGRRLSSEFCFWKFLLYGLLDVVGKQELISRQNRIDTQLRFVVVGSDLILTEGDRYLLPDNSLARVPPSRRQRSLYFMSVTVMPWNFVEDRG